jgi:hypothetical protein
VDLLDHSFPDDFVDGRYSDDDGRLVCDQVTITVPNGFLGQRLDCRIGDGDTSKVKGHLDQKFQDMGKREEGDKDVVRLELRLQKSLGTGDCTRVVSSAKVTPVSL